jgi:protein-S-isoprenylcysteine O-methyltransferase Ste14
MALLKNVFDPAVKSKNLITTISGIVTLVITILVSFGVFTPEQAEGVTTQTNVLLTAVPQIISAVAALILIFKAKD